jgi:predicted DNA-binding ribbon-helix-helix protein
MRHLSTLEIPRAQPPRLKIRHRLFARSVKCCVGFFQHFCDRQHSVGTNKPVCCLTRAGSGAGMREVEGRVFKSRGAPFRKRSVVRNGRKSSLSLEEPFWDALLEIAERNNTTVRHILASIDQGKNEMFTSAIRVFVIEYYMNEAKSKSAK